MAKRLRRRGAALPALCAACDLSDRTDPTDQSDLTRHNAKTAQALPSVIVADVEKPGRD
jgi:hypothetical protein